LQTNKYEQYLNHETTSIHWKQNQTHINKQLVL